MKSQKRFVPLGTNLKPARKGGHVEAVLDQRQNLVILTQPVGGTAARFTWKDAKAEVAKLAKGKYLGHRDWRLPTVEELFLLADRTRHDPAVDTKALPFIKSDWYWSSTPSAANPRGYAWNVNFCRGYAYIYYQSYDGLVLAVRGGAAAPGQ